MSLKLWSTGRAGVLLIASMLLVLSGSLFIGMPPAAGQSGADLAASISGKKTVKIGVDITYTITATNVGDVTATGVHIDGWVPDWFNFVGKDCLTGTPTYLGCDFSDLAPGASARMTFTVQALYREKKMFEQGYVSASNDTNLGNDTATIKVVFTGKRS
jgi:uncharacterized repeat protein (TIGR01451 family)